jgi:hypothetical protein
MKFLKEGVTIMSWRLDDIPVYEQKATTVAAADYNRVAIALKRLGEPLIIALPGLRSLELILDHEAWIVVDRDHNEIPVLAWTDFLTEGRSSLHEPIACVLNTYHVHAPIILEQVREFMEKTLAKRLAKAQEAHGQKKVTSLKKE